MQRNFLVVAANGKTREALASELRKHDFTVTLAGNGSEAERVVSSVSVESVLIESHLPDMTAEDLRDRIVRLRPDCRVNILTSFELVRNTPGLLRFGANDYVMDAGQVFDLIRAPYEAMLFEAYVSPRVEQEKQALMQVIDVLVGLLELDDRQFSGTSHHSMQLARSVAEEMGGDEESIQEVVLGTLLRDVGRSVVEPNVLPEDGDGPTPDDNREVRDHVQDTLRLFEHIDFPWKVNPVVRHHHERYDGSGSPDGLRGREIPMGARIVAVVDAYVALTSPKQDRPCTPEDAMSELVRRAGHQFDSEVVEAFHRVLEKRLAGRRSKGDPRVLIVEQETQFRRLVKMRLLNEGLDVDEATTYRKAWRKLRRRPPDLALIDLDADTNEAFQLLQDMQADDKTRMVPVAFISQRSDRLLRIRALRQGIDDFLSKSDDMDELVARLENILIRQAVRSEGDSGRPRRGITGDLQNLSLPDIIQTLTIGMKTACVTLASEERTGKIWFENGTPKHAETDELVSEQAFFEMVRWKTGEFVIEHGLRPEEDSLEQDAMFLLMEGLRLMDEASEESFTSSL